MREKQLIQAQKRLINRLIEVWVCLIFTREGVLRILRKIQILETIYKKKSAKYNNIYL